MIKQIQLPPPLLPLSYPFLFLSRLPQKPNREGEGKIFTSFITTTGALVVITATPTFCSEVNEAMQTYHTYRVVFLTGPP